MNMDTKAHKQPSKMLIGYQARILERKGSEQKQLGQSQRDAGCGAVAGNLGKLSFRPMTALLLGWKCSHTGSMLRFSASSRLVLERNF